MFTYMLVSWAFAQLQTVILEEPAVITLEQLLPSVVSLVYAAICADLPEMLRHIGGCCGGLATCIAVAFGRRRTSAEPKAVANEPTGSDGKAIAAARATDGALSKAKGTPAGRYEPADLGGGKGRTDLVPGPPRVGAATVPLRVGGATVQYLYQPPEEPRASGGAQDKQLFDIESNAGTTRGVSGVAPDPPVASPVRG
jgi:hypothetical protein